MTRNLTWDEYGLLIAQTVSLKSKDPSTKVGALILGPDKQPLSFGFNGFPRGVKDLPERYADRNVKYAFVAHAERNAIDLCSARPKGATLYLNRPFVCKECAKSIVQSGITRVVVNAGNTFGSGTQNIWSDDAIVTETIFKEAGVIFDKITLPEGI